MKVNSCALNLKLWLGWSWVAVCLLAAIPAARAADPMIVTSASKQFIVRGVPHRSFLSANPNSETVFIEPGVLAMTCETVKRALQRELGWGERWQGTVFLNIHPIRFDTEIVQTRATRAGNLWRYSMDVPDEVSKRDLLEALVEVLLVEFADRAGTEKSVALPPWLAEGLTAHLMQGQLAGIVLQASTLDEIGDQPALRVARTTRQADVDQLLRDTVRRHGAFTFDQLNWPDIAGDDDAGAIAYRHSAHLFVRELLQLRGGPDCICAMLAMLPEHLNWQTAFLRGFEPHFHRMLDVEKWWSLSLAQWKTHDNSVVWSSTQARQ
jgi:hypothetical protein